MDFHPSAGMCSPGQHSLGFVNQVSGAFTLSWMPEMSCETITWHKAFNLLYKIFLISSTQDMALAKGLAKQKIPWFLEHFVHIIWGISLVTWLKDVSHAFHFPCARSFLSHRPVSYTSSIKNLLKPLMHTCKHFYIQTAILCAPWNQRAPRKGNQKVWIFYSWANPVTMSLNSQERL